MLVGVLVDLVPVILLSVVVGSVFTLFRLFDTIDGYVDWCVAGVDELLTTWIDHHGSILSESRCEVVIENDGPCDVAGGMKPKTIVSSSDRPRGLRECNTAHGDWRLRCVWLSRPSEEN